MGKCTENTSRWSHAADVSPNELDAFLEHIETCPFHAEAFREEEEKLRAIYRLARGLDNRGNILLGRRLRGSIAKHDLRQAAWKKAAGEMKLPFKSIYLRNRGENIATSGKFFDFRKYEGDHMLDPRAGLQIWGVIGEKDSQDALLGFYPLDGVQHTGREELLHLDNGYTVGLQVEQLTERNFKIGFRCVDNAILGRERSGFIDQQPAASVVRSVASGNSFLGRFAEKVNWVISGLTRPAEINFRRKVAAVTVCCLIVSVAVGSRLHPARYGETELVVPPVSLGTSEERIPLVSWSRESVTGHSGKTPAKPIKPSRQVDSSRDGKTPTEGGSNLLVASNANLVETPLDPEPEVITGAEAGPTWYFGSVGLADMVTPDAIHSGSDPILRDKLSTELKKRSIVVMWLDTCSPTQGNVMVTWNIIRQGNSVTVEARLVAGGDQRFLSFSREGTCSELACERAVRDAVSKVFANIQDMTSDATN